MPKLVLGSGSIARLNLLKQIQIVPDIISPADVDETPLKKEKPLDYIKRIAELKAETLHQKHFSDVILCADTIVTYQSRIFQKPKDNEELIKNLKFFSSKNIRLATCIYVITADNKRIKKVVETTLKFKNLNPLDIEEYVKLDCGTKTAGGIMIESLMEAFVVKIIGSYSNIIGLPLYETRNILISAGIKTNIK